MMNRCSLSFLDKDSRKVKMKIDCEIASSYSQKAKGLMYKEVLRPDEGMVFEFFFPFFHLFWMYRVLVPLDIIFIRQGRVRKVVEADVKSGLWALLYCCGACSDLVVEVNKGMCKKNDIVPGCFVEKR